MPRPRRGHLLRTCNKCGDDKPIKSFPKRSGKSAHLRENTCGMCKKRANIARHPEKPAAEAIRRRARARGLTPEQYLATKRGRLPDSDVSPIYAAQRSRVRIDGLIVRKNQKRQCPLLAAYPKVKYQINADFYREKSKRWGRLNPEKAYAKKLRRKFRLLNVVDDLTPGQWREIKRSFSYRCAYCYRSDVKLTRDHVVPVSRGGGNTVSNVVPACLRCNLSKFTGPPPIPVQTRLFA